MTAAFYDNVCIRCSRLITHAYSTSFSMGILCFERKVRDPIYSIYGFVRFADEIVDTFHDHDKKNLLEKFRQETHQAIHDNISLNPVLHNFQKTVNKYQIEPQLIDQFLKSMAMDIDHSIYDQQSYESYILGSAEVVGLMCLKVFCHDNKPLYEHLTPYAMKLGAAFQKVNFLRDLKADYQILGRTYFPNIEMTTFNEICKAEIEKDIQANFDEAYIGIKQLPSGARLGVYLSYIYYLRLFHKICKTSSVEIMERRIRIPNQQKYSLLFTSYIKHRFNLI